MNDDPVWEDGAGLARPSLTGDVTADVCVIGLGGSGLTAVDELRSRGATVVGLDAGTVGGGAAGRNGGFLLAGLARGHHRVVAQLGRPVAAALHRSTLEEIGRIAQRTPEAVRITGSVRIEDSDEGLADCRVQAEALLADGFTVADYEGPEGRGLLFADDGVLQPLLRCRSLAAEVPHLYERTPAVTAAAGRVTTPTGSVSCGAVVVAVDGRLDRLLPELAGRVRTVRLQMLATAPTDEVVVPRPVYLRDGYDYYQQLPDGRLAVGGCRDLGGHAEETHDATPTSLVQQAIEDLLRTRLRVTAPVTHRWAASVGYTADGLPFVGQVRDGVWAAGGYCGTGNVIGALAGRALACAALGQDGSGFWPYLG